MHAVDVMKTVLACRRGRFHPSMIDALRFHITPEPDPGSPPSPAPIPGPAPVTDPPPIEIPQPTEIPPITPPPVVDPPVTSPMA
jgi:hypothetical protein